MNIYPYTPKMRFVKERIGLVVSHLFSQNLGGIGITFAAISVPLHLETQASSFPCCLFAQTLRTEC